MKKLFLFPMVLLLPVLLTACSGLGGLSSPKISDITTFRFGKVTGTEMNAGYSYQAVRTGENVTVTIRPEGAPEENAIVIADPAYPVMESLRKLAEEYKLNRWDGFDKVSSGVMDGKSFSLYIEMDNGETISARGYARWPADYAKAEAAIKTLFDMLLREAEG